MFYHSYTMRYLKLPDKPLEELDREELLKIAKFLVSSIKDDYYTNLNSGFREELNIPVKRAVCDYCGNPDCGDGDVVEWEKAVRFVFSSWYDYLHR